MHRRVVLAAALLAVAAVGAATLWLHPVGLADVRRVVGGLAGWRQAHPWQAAGLYFALYVAVTALSLPLATWLTLGGGALFGFWLALVLTSFASTLGATLAFLAARFVLRDWVARRLGERMQRIRDGFSRDGAFYLFTLRLIPAVPFFAVNLLMGFTAIGVATFWWVSQLGMLAGTAVYVNAGTRLARIDSLAGLLSPVLIASFVLLGIFPWIARAGIALIRRRRITARWTRPKRFDRNLIVIGAGSAGLVSAYIGAAAKAKVTLIEAERMGGDCLNTGCVPSKTLIRSAKLAHEMRHAGRLGLGDTPPQVPFDRVMARVFQAIGTIAPHDSAERYAGLGVDVRRGRARLVDPWTVAVTGEGGTERLTARAIVLATGAAPVVPKLPGIDKVGALTSETLWTALRHDPHPPARLAVLGGGPVGCELAQAFARLGSEVTQIERGPRLLKREDDEVSAFARAALEADGVRVLCGARARACGVTDGERWIEFAPEGETEDAVQRIAFDRLIVAVGRAARLEGYGLETLGIETGRVIETDAWLRTRYPSILACGDVAGPCQFTHWAAHQAWFATLNALAAPFWRRKVTDRAMPACTFTDPQIARVGLTEREARARGIAFEVTRYPLSDLDRAITDGAAQGFVKVLTPPGRDRILGVTIVGAEAGEMLAEFVLAMKQGLGLGKILGTVHAYPTLAEANRNAAGAWRRAHVNPRLLALAERFHDWRRG